MVGTMKDVAMMGLPPLPGTWTQAIKNTWNVETDPETGRVTQTSSGEIFDPKTNQMTKRPEDPWSGKMDDVRPMGQKHIIDWFRDSNVPIDDPNALEGLVKLLRSFKNPLNPTGNPDNPFSPTHYVIPFEEGDRGPYSGYKDATIHNIEYGMTDEEKMHWREKWDRPKENNPYLNWD